MYTQPWDSFALVVPWPQPNHEVVTEYLMELMNDDNKEIKKFCYKALDIIAVSLGEHMHLTHCCCLSEGTF